MPPWFSAVVAIVFYVIGAASIFFLGNLWVQEINFRLQRPTLLDIILWSEDVSISAPQIQKTYDWTIAQWSGIATAALTATLGFLSTVVVETLKGTTLTSAPVFMGAVAIGVGSSVAISAFCHFQMNALNNDFATLYDVLTFLR
jgi:hypothetical protein